MYEKSAYENLRSLKQIVLNFKRIFDVLPPKALSMPDVIEALVRSLTALSIEVQRGDLPSNEIGDLVNQNAERIAARHALQRNKNADKEELKKISPAFLEKYSLFFTHSLFPGEAWWQNFFDKGILDIEGLTSAFESSVYFQRENMPDWQKIWHFSELTEEQFKALLPRVVSAFENQSFENIQVVRHVFGVLLKLSHNELYSESPEQILDKGKVYVKSMIDKAYASGLEDLFTSADLSVKILGSAYGYMGSFGLAYQGSNYVEFKAFEAYASEYGEVVKQRCLPSVADELLILMKTDKWKFKRALCLGQYDTDAVKSYYNVPILKFMDVDKFIANLVDLRSSEDLGLVGYTLKERYSSANHGLEEELDWLQTLNKKIANELDSQEKTILGYRLARFKIEYIDPIIQKIKDDSQPSP